MARELSTPKTVRARLGPVEATHEFHSFSYSDRDGSPRIDSQLSYGLMVDGSLVELPETSSNATITGKDLESLGTSLTPQAVRDKHQEISQREEDKRAA